MSRFLITGGAGFIGSHLADLLISRGHQVLILDALSWGSNLKNLPLDLRVVGGLQGQMVNDIPEGRCVLVVGDVSNTQLVKQLVNTVDGVFHLASQTHVDRSYGDVLPFVNSNVVGSYAVLEAVRQAKYKLRCIFVSTDEVYGEADGNLNFTELAPLSPRNIYSTLKAGGDLLAQAYAEIFNLDIVIVRPANNYGPRQFHEKLIPRIMKRFKELRSGIPSEKIPIYGDGNQIRDWLYVTDTALGFWYLYERGKSGQAYNLGAHQFRTVLEVVKEISDLIEVDWMEHVEYKPDRIRGDKRYGLNLEKTKKEIGWEAFNDFKTGLIKTVEWYLH